MDRKVGEYLREMGYRVAPDAAREGAAAGGDAPGTYLEWFDTTVLGLDSEAYRRAFWREAYATGRTIGHVPRTFNTLVRRYPGDGLSLLLTLSLLEGAVYPFWILARLLSREVSRLRRSSYYERERERRWRLADERVAIRLRRTANPRPALEDVRAAWARVHATKGREHALAVLRCGALLEDLEGYVDNHAYVTRGVPGVRGRAPGIKGLFREKAPDLSASYKDVMRCKALAKKYRQAVGCPDPVPTTAVLPVDAPAASPPSPAAASVVSPPAPSAPSDFAADRSDAKSEGAGGEPERGTDGGKNPWRGETVEAGGLVFPLLPCLRDADALAAWMAAHGNTAYLRTQEWVRSPDIVYTAAHLLPSESRTEAARILSFGEGTLVAVEAAVALRIDPACVDAEPGARVVRTAGGRRAPSTPRRVREWLAGRIGRRARSGAAA